MPPAVSCCARGGVFVGVGDLEDHFITARSGAYLESDGQPLVAEAAGN